MDAVTGAWSYLGQHIAMNLLRRGRQVRTLTTRHPPRQDPFEGKVAAVPLTWDVEDMAGSLQGVEVLYNTYWVRHDLPPFGHRGEWTDHSQAVRNSRLLFEAAREAKVRRVVQVSITQPRTDSRLTYFRGKAEVEGLLQESGISHAILRPSLFFGAGDILLNNIGWAVRRFPFFPLPGPLGYSVRPIHVSDMARLCCDQGEEEDSVVLDACGPEQYPFDELVRLLGRVLAGRAPRILALPIPVCLRLYQAAGLALGDTVLSRAELQGLASDLLRSEQSPLGSVVLSDWIASRTDSLGLKFHPEPPRLVKSAAA